MDLVTLALTVVSTALGVVIAIQSRQLKRAALRLHFGVLGLDKKMLELARRHPKRALMFGLPDRERDYFVVGIPIGIENASALPVTSIRLQLQYPTECVVDDTRVVDAEHGPYNIGKVVQRTRTVQRIGETAQVVTDVELLRPKEKLVIYELVRIPREHAPLLAMKQNSQELERRWRSVPGFFAGFELRIALWAANCDAHASTAVVAACAAESPSELTELGTRLLASLWDDYRPQAGIVGRFARWRRWWTIEFAELVFLSSDLLQPGAKQISFSPIERARHALLKFALPPWGFTGQSFDAPGTGKITAQLTKLSDS